jgi:hypothetical protein
LASIRRSLQEMEIFDDRDRFVDLQYVFFSVAVFDTQDWDTGVWRTCIEARKRGSEYGLG